MCDEKVYTHVLSMTKSMHKLVQCLSWYPNYFLGWAYSSTTLGLLHCAHTHVHVYAWLLACSHLMNVNLKWVLTNISRRLNVHVFSQKRQWRATPRGRMQRWWENDSKWEPLMAIYTIALFFLRLQTIFHTTWYKAGCSQMAGYLTHKLSSLQVITMHKQHL